MIRSLLKSLLPPLVAGAARRAKRLFVKSQPPEWEYLPAGWLDGARHHGWNHRSILETQLTRWPQFLRRVQSTNPLGVAYEHPGVPAEDHGSHEYVMAFGYVLGLASHRKDSIKILDWGGGLGHYYVIGTALFPSLIMNYHVYDNALLCEGGRSLLPPVFFHEDDVCLDERYDLAMANGSLHYSRDWRRELATLALASGAYLYLSRVPCVSGVPSFAAVQRPGRYGYATELTCWILNRAELTEFAASIGLLLIREFLIQEKPSIHNAPEQAVTRGFLFTVPADGAKPA